MSLPNEIQLAPLDFDTIKTQLKLFLKNQTTLQDYNFEGSALAILIDVLAFDAYYHGWYTNFAVNEAFLQTAQLRNSVVSAARQVGYVPRSVSSSIALTNITVSNQLTVYSNATLSSGSGNNNVKIGADFRINSMRDGDEFIRKMDVRAANQ